MHKNFFFIVPLSLLVLWWCSQNQPVSTQNQPVSTQNQPVSTQNQPASTQNQPVVNTQQTNTVSTDPVFQKKQECANYYDEAKKWVEEEFDGKLEELFYSPTRNSCIVIESEESWVEWHKSYDVYDFLNGRKYLFWKFFDICSTDITSNHTWDFVNCNKDVSDYNKQLQELKWE